LIDLAVFILVTHMSDWRQTDGLRPLTRYA